MKFLQVPELEVIGNALSFETADCHVFGRVEAYSCKHAGNDRKLLKFIDQKYEGGMGSSLEDFAASPDLDRRMLGRDAAWSMSPPPAPSPSLPSTRASSSPSVSIAVRAGSLTGGEDDAIVGSPFGPLNLSASRRTFFYLIATLNASFPDYDFSDVKPEQFSKVPNVSAVSNAVNTTLMTVGRGHLLRDYQFWDRLDNTIHLDDCTIYRYTPDLESDPYECSLWSYNYLFLNRKLKRILFFSLHSVSNTVIPTGEHDSGSSSELESANGGYDDYIMAGVEV